MKIKDYYNQPDLTDPKEDYQKTQDEDPGCQEFLDLMNSTFPEFEDDFVKEFGGDDES